MLDFVVTMPDGVKFSDRFRKSYWTKAQGTVFEAYDREVLSNFAGRVPRQLLNIKL